MSDQLQTVLTFVFGMLVGAFVVYLVVRIGLKALGVRPILKILALKCADDYVDYCPDCGRCTCGELLHTATADGLVTMHEAGCPLAEQQDPEE